MKTTIAANVIFTLFRCSNVTNVPHNANNTLESLYRYHCYLVVLKGAVGVYGAL